MGRLHLSVFLLAAASAVFLIAPPLLNGVVAVDTDDIDGDEGDEFEMPDEYSGEDEEEGEGFAGMPPGMMDDIPAHDTKTETVPPAPYHPPSTDGLHYAELFDDGWETRWLTSTKEKFGGGWERTLRQDEALLGDYGIRVMDQAKHHAIAARYPKVDPKGKGLVVSYEAKFETGLSCGGAYLKLFDSKGMDMKSFDNDTPYVIMFGPDRCGPTNKVHLIIKSLNPISHEWMEHHLKSPPSVPSGKDTHLYTVHISADDEYEVLVDGLSKRKGSMLEDFEPAFTPPSEVDDPEDSKPEDWIDDPEMNDPDASKPEDWDEEAPKMIEDPDATLPEGWLVDEPETVPDPDASTPEDWDEEEDGPWKAPSVVNPKCAVGCGPWHHPMVPNPDFKGPWIAPRIKNPQYKGPWAPGKIPNKNYYLHEHPHELSGSSIDAVGFELWTMDSGLLFDNIVVSQNWEATQRFIEQTFKVRQTIESSRSPAEAPKPSTLTPTDSLTEKVYSIAVQNPLLALTVAFTVAVVLLVLMRSLRSVCKRGGDVKVAEAKDEGTKKKEDAKKKQQKQVSGSDDEEEEEEDEKKKPAEGQKARKRAGRAAHAD